MLLRLAYLRVTNALALLRLLPMSDRDKDAEILALRHQIMVLERQLGGDRVQFAPAARAWLAALLHPLPRTAHRPHGLSRHSPWSLRGPAVRINSAFRHRRPSRSGVRSDTVKRPVPEDKLDVQPADQLLWTHEHVPVARMRLVGAQLPLRTQLSVESHQDLLGRARPASGALMVPGWRPADGWTVGAVALSCNVLFGACDEPRPTAAALLR